MSKIKTWDGQTKIVTLQNPDIWENPPLKLVPCCIYQRLNYALLSKSLNLLKNNILYCKTKQNKGMDDDDKNSSSPKRNLTVYSSKLQENMDINKVLIVREPQNNDKDLNVGKINTEHIFHSEEDKTEDLGEHI